MKRPGNSVIEDLNGVEQIESFLELSLEDNVLSNDDLQKINNFEVMQRKGDIVVHLDEISLTVWLYQSPFFQTTDLNVSKSGLEIRIEITPFRNHADALKFAGKKLKDDDLDCLKSTRFVDVLIPSRILLDENRVKKCHYPTEASEKDAVFLIWRVMRK